MSIDRIKADLDDAALSWARRMERERAEAVMARARADRAERTVWCLVVVSILCFLGGAGALLYIASGGR